MPKALSLTSLVLAVVVVVLFLTDLVMGLAGMSAAPMGGFSILMDLVFVLAGALVIYMSWLTLKEVR